jgi:hypothetical protein
MDLWTEDVAIAQPTNDQISQTLLDLGDGEYAIIGNSKEVYMQTFRTKSGFLLEKARVQPMITMRRSPLMDDRE